MAINWWSSYLDMQFDRIQQCKWKVNFYYLLEPEDKSEGLLEIQVELEDPKRQI
jgi:hypothetical protein